MLLPASIPTLPDEMLQRFPKGAVQFNEQTTKFWNTVKRLLVDSQQDIATAVNDADNAFKSRTAVFGTDIATLTARITAEEIVRATQDGALATSIATVSAAYIAADTAIGALITAESTARASADGALATSISSVSAAVGAAVASVTAEATARASADGNLSGKYTLLVAAGDLVTGINISSAVGPGTNLSTITFQTDRLRVQTASGSPISLLDISAYGFVFGTHLVSSNYVPGSAGWALSYGGNLEANSGYFRGTLDVGGGATRTLIDGTAVTFGYGTGNVTELSYSGGTTRMRQYVGGSLLTELGSAGYGYLQFNDTGGIGTTILGNGPIGLRVYSPGSGSTAIQVKVNGDSDPRFDVLADGKHEWGSGGNPHGDTNLYRNSPGSLRTDGNLDVGGTLYVGGISLGGGLSVGGGLDVNGAIHVHGSGQNIYIDDGVIQKATPDGWSVYNYDGNYLFDFQFDGTTFKVRINNSIVLDLST